MKRITLVTFFLTCLFFSGKGQNTTVDSDFKRNEIKINILYLLVPILEVSYERILNEESSIGSRVGVGFGNTDYLFEFMPYYRMYFSTKPASGFFAEINANTFVTKSNYYTNYGSTTTNNLNFGMGLAVGGKFLTRNKNNAFEVYGGLGRSFSNNDNYSFYPALGVSFGKRF